MKTRFCLNLIFLSLIVITHPLFCEKKPLVEEFLAASTTPEAALFTPPQGWVAADPQILPKSVKAMIIGKGSKEYPPSINLSLEPYEGTLKTYLKTVKQINDSKGALWKDLGQIATKTGNASLSQVDLKTEWGDVRLIHLIQIKYGTAYILTAASLKEEFPEHYQTFLEAFKSFKINPDIFDQVENPVKRAKLQSKIEKFKSKWERPTLEQQGFTPAERFDLLWAPLQETLTKDFETLPPEWHEAVRLKVRKSVGIE